MSDGTQEGNLDSELEQVGEVAEIANEFAYVRVRKVLTRNGERLEIAAPKLGYVIRLDAIELESLSWQTTETFSGFLETPFGP
jgi:hypothetical protein